MKRPLLFTISTLLLLLASLHAADRINGAGASFPAPVYSKWVETYNNSTNNKVFYQSIGSSGGIKQMKYKTIDFGGTDAPLKPREQQRYQILQFPSVIGAIVLAYNIKGVGDGELKLSNKATEGIFLGDITHWNDPIIAQDNPKLALPNEEITVIHRNDGSGTTKNFTDYLSTISKRWAKKVGSAKAVVWPVGEGAKGNEGISNLLRQLPYSIGYLSMTHKMKHGFSSAQVQSKNGTWVPAKEDTIANAAAFARWKPEDGFYLSLIYQPGNNTYPITLATFVMMHANSEGVTKQVTKFFDWAFKNGDDIVKEKGFVPLPLVTKDKIRQYWKSHKVF